MPSTNMCFIRNLLANALENKIQDLLKKCMCIKRGYFMSSFTFCNLHLCLHIEQSSKYAKDSGT